MEGRGRGKKETNGHYEGGSAPGNVGLRKPRGGKLPSLEIREDFLEEGTPEEKKSRGRASRAKGRTGTKVGR